MRIRVRQLVAAALATALGQASLTASAADPGGAARPNVLVIVADDLGNGDLGIQGGKDIPTPNIDSIAKRGVRFANGYVSCPVCSPTRAGLLTGRYQTRLGHEFNPGPQAADNFGLPASEPTIADAFKSAGYATGLVGKWHLGNKPELQPPARGFSEFYGFLGGAHPYLTPDQVVKVPGATAQPAAGANAAADPQARPARRAARQGRQQQGDAAKAPAAGDAQPASAAGRSSLQGIYRGSQTIDESRYLTDAFGDEAVAYLDRHQKDPFFLYLAFNAVHLPAHATQKYLDRFPKLEGQRKVYAAQLSALDDAVGRVLTKLRDSKLEENTLVVFFSDNGGPKPNGSSNGVFNATKGTVYEGGVRVPFFVQWKGKLPAGAVREDLVSTIDVYPTSLAAAGIPTPTGKQLDGVDILPVAKGDAGARAHDTLYWRFGPQWAVRDGKWKLAKPAAGPNAKAADAAPKLFDLSADPGEQTDVSAANPQVVQALQAKWDAWNKENKEPLWGRNSGARAAAE